jgi:signal transduction histidine kinase
MLDRFKELIKNQIVNGLGIILLIFCIGACNYDHSTTEVRSKGKVNIKENIIYDSIQVLDSLCNVYLNTNDSICSLYAKRALRLGESLPVGKQLVNAYSAMGNSFYMKLKDSSFFYYYKALTLANRFNLVKEKAKLLYNIGELNFEAGNYKNALVIFDSCIASSRLSSNFKVLSDAYNSMADIYLQIHDTAFAKKMFNKALAIGIENSLPQETGAAMSNLASCEKDSRKSLLMRKNALVFLKKIKGTELEIAKVNINIGASEINPDSAIFYYNRALKEIPDRSQPLLEISSYNNMAYAYLDLKNIKKAFELLDKAIFLAKKDTNLEWLSTLYDSYADVLSANHDDKSALIAIRRSIEYKTEFEVKKNAQQIRLLSAILDLNNKELTIKEKNAEILNIGIQNKFLRLIVLLAVLTIVIIVFIYIGYRQKTKLRFKQQLITSARKIIDMEETEKSRLGFELHDNLGFLMRATESFINSIKIEDEKMKREMADKMSELSSSVRRISHRVNLMKDEQSPIQELIPDIINDMKTFTGIDVSYFIPEHLPPLSKEIRLHICRIVQELLTNASKYASGSKIRIDLVQVEKYLTLFYKDNGPGFNSTRIEGKGIGLNSIYERTSLLGGTAKLKTEPGKGTQWEITVPVKTKS